MSLDNIFGKPSMMKDIGGIFPIRVKQWEKFQTYLPVLMMSKKQIELDSDEDLPLLHLLVLGLQSDEINNILCTVFNTITRTESFKLELKSDTYFFVNNKGQKVTPDNYEDIRKIVLHQNIIFEPKVYKNKMMQEWAEKVLEARSKNSANIDFEDMITTIAALSGKHYKDLEEYTVYQLRAEFARWNKIKEYDSTSILYANPHIASEIKLDHFAEMLDLYKDPYADVFKSNNTSKLNKAFSNAK
ncbi:hypothetical protein ABFV99_00590 [Cytobacillus horneckiae]|uniref:hypothetical protein n=1 Tax=Cytobacillus horneckiae TaxID=549687 RepID=UPI0034CE6351